MFGARNTRETVLVLPDPLSSTAALPPATFLFFNKPLSLILPSVIITHDLNPYRLIDDIHRRNPGWRPVFDQLFSYWVTLENQHLSVISEIGPMKGQLFESLWVAHDANVEELEIADQLIIATGLDVQEIAANIDHLSSAAEIMRHIFVEAFVSVGADVGRLYEYCDDFFGAKSLNDVLVRGFFLRLAGFRLPQLTSSKVPFVSTCIYLPKFLSHMPVQVSPSEAEIFEIKREIASWHLFQAVLGRYFGTLDKKVSEVLVLLSNTKCDELTRLRRKCAILGEHLIDNNLWSSRQMAKEYVALHVQPEIDELLALNRKATVEFTKSIFSDEKTWAALLAFLGSSTMGANLIQAGAALAMLSFVGAKAFKSACDRHETLKSSDYALLYSVAHLVDKKYN